MATLFLALLPAQYVDSKEFAQDRQKAALEATVALYHPSSGGEGTAVFVKHKDGVAYLLTAAHNVPDGDRGDVVNLDLFTAKSYPNAATRIEGAFVRVRMENEDIALVLAPMKDAPPSVLPICPKSKLPRPERTPFPVLTVGCNGEKGRPILILDRVLGKELVSKPNGTRAVFWQAEREQAKGRSGGPLIDSRGYLMGICSGIQKGRGYYSCIDEIQRSLERASYGWLFAE